MSSLKLLLALVLGAAACFGALAVTEPPGPGLDPDAVSYFGAAESLVHDGTFRVPVGDWQRAEPSAPLAHFPPGFSVAIAAPVAFGMSAAQGARLVVALSAFVTVALAAWLVATLVEGAAGLAAAVVLALLCLAPPLVDVHLSALSEPLFLALLVATLALMVRAPAQPLGYGLTAAAAALVRYAGLAVAGAVVLWTLLAGRGSVGVRLRRALVAALPTIVGMGAWVLRTRRVAPHGGIRTLGRYGDVGATARQGLDTLQHWLAPGIDDDRARALLALVAIALVLLLLVRAGAVLAAALRRTRVERIVDPTGDDDVLRALGALALLLVAYAGFVVLARLVADPDIPFDWRILSPAILLLSLGIALAAGVAWREGGRLWRLATVVALAAWAAGALRVDRDDVDWALTNGSDFAGAEWRQSPLVAWTEAHAARRAVWTNWPAALYFAAHRATHELPEAPDERSAAAQGDALARAFRDTLARRDGLLVAFGAPSPGMANPDSLARRAGLRQVARVADGAVWAP